MLHAVELEMFTFRFGHIQALAYSAAVLSLALKVSSPFFSCPQQMSSANRKFHGGWSTTGKKVSHSLVQLFLACLSKMMCNAANATLLLRTQ
jgi:hypothetical protein